MFRKALENGETDSNDNAVFSFHIEPVYRFREIQFFRFAVSLGGHVLFLMPFPLVSNRETDRQPKQ